MNFLIWSCTHIYRNIVEQDNAQILLSEVSFKVVYDGMTYPIVAI